MTEHMIVAPGGPFELRPQGELVYISDEFSCVPTPNIDRPLRVPALLHSGSTKPFLYSVDVYRSWKEGEYVAVSSFPIKDAVKTGRMVKPYAVGKTPQEAEGKLAISIKCLTGRKETGVINVRYETKLWLCVHCTSGSTFETKPLLMEHLTRRHNTGVEKYTNPTDADTFHILPLKAGI